MLKVDILILPLFLYLQKYQKHFFPTYKRNIKWFPVWYYQNDLKRMGVKIRFLNCLNLKYSKLSNIVCIDDSILDKVKNFDFFLKKLRKNIEFLIWFDHSDNTSQLQYKILPYVDKYLKRQLLKDRSLYSRKFYDDNIFRDFYARTYNLDTNGKRIDENKINSSLKINMDFDPKYLKKIDLSWNFALCDYNNFYYDKGFFNRLNQYVSICSNSVNLKFHKPNMNRKIIFANYSINYYNELASFQRKQLLKILNEKYKFSNNLSIGLIPKKKYLKYAASSKAIFSPFGGGEICFRDFETFIAGAALIKPDIDHLETWPNCYKKYDTYIPLPWKIEDWETLIPKILSNEKLLFEIARNGQNSYKKIWTKEGKETFCNRFIEMITPK